MYPLWARHGAAAKFCFVIDLASSVRTLCRGAWSAADDYEISVDPSLGERCAGCERARIVETGRQQIERGLAELAANAPELPTIEFDLGGES